MTQDLREAVIGLLREEGLDVITDTETGQRALDMAGRSDAVLSKAQKRAAETVSVSSDEEHQQTVISTADGAKVLKNLDNLAEELDNLTHNHVKTFLGNVAKSAVSSCVRAMNNVQALSIVSSDIMGRGKVCLQLMICCAYLM